MFEKLLQAKQFEIARHLLSFCSKCVII